MDCVSKYDGLIVVFATAIGLSLLAALAPLLRGTAARTTMPPQPQEAL
jgi:hypothetical protein